jgi:DNA-binding MarR family transcriptional regulator
MTRLATAADYLFYLIHRPELKTRTQSKPISMVQMLVLHKVAILDQPPKFDQLARLLAIPKPRLTRALHNLSDYGLLDKIPSADPDRRSFCIRLTPRGRRVTNESARFFAETATPVAIVTATVRSPRRKSALGQSIAQTSFE